jgi:hypothetical protein
MAKAKWKTAKLKLDEAELDTLSVGLKQACDATSDEVDYIYFRRLLGKIEKAQKKLIKEAA